MGHGKFPDLYRHRETGAGVWARETTAADVNAGRAGAVGDYLAMRDGHGSAQWWTRAAFLEQHAEALTRELPELHNDVDSAAAAIDPPAPPPPTPAPVVLTLEERVTELEELVAGLTAELEAAERSPSRSITHLIVKACYMAAGATAPEGDELEELVNAALGFESSEPSSSSSSDDDKPDFHRDRTTGLLSGPIADEKPRPRRRGK